MTTKEELALRVNKKFTKQFLDDPSGYTLQAIGGFIKDSDGTYGLIKNTGIMGINFARAFIHGQGLTQLFRDLEKYRDRGEIVDYLDDPWGKDTLSELFGALDNEKVLTTERLEILRALLRTSLSTSADDNKRFFAREMVKVALKLGPMDVRILKFLEYWRVKKNMAPGQSFDTGEWENQIINEVGQELSGRIHDSLDHLTEMHLVESREESNRFHNGPAERNGLTTMGVAFIEYISNFEDGDA